MAMMHTSCPGCVRPTILLERCQSISSSEVVSIELSIRFSAWDLITAGLRKGQNTLTSHLHEVLRFSSVLATPTTFARARVGPVPSPAQPLLARVFLARVNLTT